MAPITTIAVIGRNGQLAQTLAEMDWPRYCQPRFLGSNEIDLFATTAARRHLADLRPAAIINTAAFSDVDRAEAQMEACWRLNATLPAQLASIAELLHIPLVHVSSDYVFDGHQRTPYREDAAPHPLSAYGSSKLAGEAAVLAHDSTAVVARTSWLFGRHGRNFLKTILATALSSPNVPLRVVNDQIGTPTSTAALAIFLRTLALDLARGRTLPRLLHFSGRMPTSRYEFAAALLETFCQAKVVSMPPRLIPISTDSLASPARRPSYSALDCQQAIALGYDVPEWDSALQELAGTWTIERKVA